MCGIAAEPGIVGDAGRGVSHVFPPSRHVAQVRAPASMAAPLCGKQVVIDGLASRPELNGKIGTAESFNDATG